MVTIDVETVFNQREDWGKIYGEFWNNIISRQNANIISI